MTRKTNIPFILFLLVVILQAFYAPKIYCDNPANPFDGLINHVLATDSESVEISADLNFLIEEFSADTLVSLEVADKVLSYLTNVYKEHGYAESGNWVTAESSYVYVPYRGNLPDYLISDFQLPVDGCLNSPYGFRNTTRRFHRGIDIALNIGDTVFVALPGVVTKVGYQAGGYGNYVVVAHAGEVETLYAHLSFALVSPGQQIETGKPIGLGGQTGNSTGPHLHFETRCRGIAIDPVSWFGINTELKNKP